VCNEVLSITADLSDVMSSDTIRLMHAGLIVTACLCFVRNSINATVESFLSIEATISSQWSIASSKLHLLLRRHEGRLRFQLQLQIGGCLSYSCDCNVAQSR
jgi:hypothetical protein